MRSQRQRLLDAMIACCAEKTFPRTTIADIVAAASVSRTTFYKRFTGKRDCFDAAVDSCVGQLQAVAEARTRPPTHRRRRFASRPAPCSS